MSIGQRIGIVAGALAVVVAAFFIARGSGDVDGGSSATTATAAEQASTGATAPTGPTGGAQAPSEEAAPAGPRVETIRIRAGKPVGGAGRLRYTRGDTVRLRFTSDTDTEVHIHGYDKRLAVPAGGWARTRFEARADGIFEIEDHDSDAVLAKLEVRP